LHAVQLYLFFDDNTAAVVDIIGIKPLSGMHNFFEIF
jgi:hypothetical protein